MNTGMGHWGEEKRRWLHMTNGRSDFVIALFKMSHTVTQAGLEPIM